MTLAALYLEDLSYLGVSETEFEILKREVNISCKFFPSVAEIVEKRKIFFDGKFIPTDADKRALIENPNYKHGREYYIYNEELVKQLECDYDEKQVLGFNPANLLKSIK